MRTSKWAIALVVIAVVAVLIAKQSARRPHSERTAVKTQVQQPENTVGQAGNPVAPPNEAATGQGAKPELGVEKGTSHPAVPPRQESTPAPSPVVAEQSKPAPSAAIPSPAAKSGARAADISSPQAAPPASKPAERQPVHDEKPKGPLPGSRLAECLKSGRPTVADFGKGWCVPCKMMVPVLKQAAQDYSGKANVVFVELDEYADLGRGYRIATMPTQIFFNAKGEEVSRHRGYMGTEDIERELAALGVKK